MFDQTIVAINDDFDNMSLEELTDFLETYGSREQVSDNMLLKIYRAIVGHIRRVLHNVKDTLNFFSDDVVARTKIEAFLRDNPNGVSNVEKIGYSGVATKDIFVYTWKIPVEEINPLITATIRNLNPVQTTSKLGDIFENIVGAVKHSDTGSLKESVREITATIRPREVETGLKKLPKIVNLNVKKNTIKFGEVFNSIGQFTEVVKEVAATDVAFFNDTVQVKKHIQRVYDASDRLIEVLEEGEVKVAGKDLKDLSKTFIHLNDYLQLYGNMVKEVDAVQNFVIKAIEGAQ